MSTHLLKRTLLIAVAATALTAQTTPRPEFEVASIKPAPLPTGNMIRIGMAGGPGTPDPGRITYDFVNLRQVLAHAFAVKPYQISGPSALDFERFNITAKIPAGTTKEVFLVMLQNLLADRFKLTLHHEKKDLAAFALVLAKGGPKLKVSSDPDPGASVPEPGRQPVDVPAGRMPMGKDGFPQMPAGGPGRGVRMMMMNGRAKLAGAITMSQLSESLAMQLDQAVIDETGLTAKYDVELTFEPRQSRMMPGLMRGPGGEGAPPPPLSDDAAPGIFTAVQEQLGLKLEPKKAPTDILVIDHVEKTPIEN
jgi:uncharacterized protein (TIGR03435 family)